MFGEHCGSHSQGVMYETRHKHTFHPENERPQVHIALTSHGPT